MSARIPREARTPAILERNEGIKLSSSGNRLVKCPYVDPNLLDYLKQTFIPKVSKEFDLRTYDRQVGHQEVIDFLAKTVQAQEEDEKDKYV